MARYTGSDIEMHLGDITEGWASTDGVDVDATRQKAATLIEEAVNRAYPNYSLSIFNNQSVGHFITVVGYPDDVDPDELAEIAGDALDDSGENYTILMMEGDQDNG